jgi:Holliday junction resolvase
MTPYKRGRAKEWAVCKELRARGWQAVRSAGSHGLWDVSCLTPLGNAVYIQVWYTKTAGYAKDENAEKFRKLKVKRNVAKEMWIYRYGTKLPEIIEC